MNFFCHATCQTSQYHSRIVYEHKHVQLIMAQVGRAGKKLSARQVMYKMRSMLCQTIILSKQPKLVRLETSGPRAERNQRSPMWL